MNKIIQSLKDRRLELKVNQSDLGKKMGMPQSHIKDRKRSERSKAFNHK